MQTTTAKPNRNKLNLLIDIGIFLAFLVAMAPRFSGIAIHEWLSIAFGATIVTHLLLHWQWIIEITKRFFGKVTAESRVNYILNALLFIDITLVIFSGLVISQSALPLFGITTAHGGIWRMLHGLTAEAAVVLIGFHIALHWQWIIKMINRFLLRPLLPAKANASATPVAPQNEG